MGLIPSSTSPEQQIAKLQAELRDANTRITQLEILTSQIRKTLEAKGIHILPRKPASR
ncbi:MAG: hypothetical protein ACLVI5_08685 [Desulfovibrio piger]